MLHNTNAEKSNEQVKSWGGGWWRWTYLGGECFLANGAFVGAFLGVTAVVDLKC